MYDGTLRADWKALVTFQQMIVLADAHGIVDMTAHAIHGRTGIPMDIIDPGIEALTKPDLSSRSSEFEGRRIVLIDDSRPWGWRIVNHTYYRNLVSNIDKREKDKIRIAKKRRKVSRSVAECRNQSSEVVNVAHTEAEAEAEAVTKKKLLARRDKRASLGDGEIVEKIPALGNVEVEVKESYVHELDRLYPAVDIPQTLREIRAWNLANIAKRKTPGGVARHINTWMAKVQNGG